MCEEAGGAGNYPIEQRMDIGHGRSRLGAAIGFGFLQSASPGAATPRGGRHAAGHSRLRHDARLGATPSRQTAVFFAPTIYRGRLPATMASSGVPAKACTEVVTGASVAVPLLS